MNLNLFKILRRINDAVYLQDNSIMSFYKCGQNLSKTLEPFLSEK